MKITRRLIISGLVQGVFFRESMRERANQLQVTGWVRNLSDGTVEAVVQGPASDVDSLSAWARRGPSRAQVQDVRFQAIDDGVDYASFEKKPSL